MQTVIHFFLKKNKWYTIYTDPREKKTLFFLIRGETPFILEIINNIIFLIQEVLYGENYILMKINNLSINVKDYK